MVKTVEEHTMHIKKIHHVAYRCIDAKQTVEWYGKYLNMDFVLAIAEDQVPSTGAPDPYMHVFLDAGAGNVLAFFELPKQTPMGRDENTPAWVQHLAMEVESMDELLAAKARLEADGIAVIGPTNHTIFKSIYFFDPNGHRLELAVNTGTPEMMQKLDAVKWDMLNEWAETRRAPQHAAWMHAKTEGQP
jgi:catechol 2,3-dioxygenase-like lactoylglutathione lyase family enzyme